jgi:hypothetical protein
MQNLENQFTTGKQLNPSLDHLANALKVRFPKVFQFWEPCVSASEVSFNIHQIRLFLGFKEELAEFVESYNKTHKKNIRWIYCSGEFVMKEY